MVTIALEASFFAISMVPVDGAPPNAQQSHGFAMRVSRESELLSLSL
jgi:hypothetical protein